MVRGRSHFGSSSKYTICSHTIAEGGYGKVRKCTDRTTNKDYAVKIFRRTAQSGGCGLPNNAIRELKLMRAVSHENVMQCHDFFQKEGHLYIVMALLDFDLLKAITNTQYEFTEGVIKSVFQQILQGLRAIHEKWFLHRDLNPKNILVDARSTHANIKIADFGTGRTFGKETMTTQVGQLWYRAPELIMTAVHYGPSVDIWSAGCILAEMYSKEALFACDAPSTITQLGTIFRVRGPITDENWPLAKQLPLFLDISKGSQPVNLKERFPPVAAELLDRMLAYDPLKRPRTDACLEDGYFTESPLPVPHGDYPWVTIPPEGAEIKGD